MSRRWRRLPGTSSNRSTDQRQPANRLAAMIAEPKPDRALRMLCRIRDELAERPDPGPWIAAARALQERGTITADAVIYLAEIFTECLISRATGSDGELVLIEVQLEAIERAHGLQDDEYWHIGEGPPEWTALNAEWDRRADAIVAAALRGFGFDDLAALIADDRAEWDARGTKGQFDVWGSELDDWTDADRTGEG